MIKNPFAILMFIQFCVLPGAFAFQVEVASAPESNLSLLLKGIREARRSLLVNIYEMKSPEIAEALMAKVREGVSVKILEEGQPVGGLSTEARTLNQKIVKVMRSEGTDCAFFEMTSDAGAERRFRFDHAKYIVIDGKSLLIGSENYSSSGHPSEGKIGNRGWESLVREPALARRFTKIFESDSATQHGDVVERVSADRPESASEALALDLGVKEEILASERSAGRPQTYEASEVRDVMSPESSLSGLVDLMAKAKESIDIELMTFSPLWGNTRERSPLLKTVLAAASRGVKVRVLLNDESVFAQVQNLDMEGASLFSGLESVMGISARRYKNPETVDILNQLAEGKQLRAKGLIADTKAMQVTYIHNKGVLVDGNKTLISSINWNQNSVENNREAAVILESPAIHRHYQELFDQDWKASGGEDI